MKNKIINLDKLLLNENGKIKKINCNEDIKRRLLDLGMVRGTNITPIFISPLNDPKAFLIKGTIIAIRKEDSEKIQIEI